MDMVDDLLDSECDEWPGGAGSEIYFDVTQSTESWFVEWVVEASPAKIESAGAE